MFKGGVSDEYVDDYAGREIAADFEKGRLQDKLSINGNIYDAKSIKAILSKSQDPDEQARLRRQEGTEAAREIWQDFNDAREQMMLLTPAERAKHPTNIAFAQMIATGMTGRTLPEDRIIEGSTKWLQAHPDFHVASPISYLSKKEHKQPDYGVDSMIHVSAILQNSVLAIAERVLHA